MSRLHCRCLIDDEGHSYCWRTVKGFLDSRKKVLPSLNIQPHHSLQCFNIFDNKKDFLKYIFFMKKANLLSWLNFRITEFYFAWVLCSIFWLIRNEVDCNFQKKKFSTVIHKKWLRFPKTVQHPTPCIVIK